MDAKTRNDTIDGPLVDITDSDDANAWVEVALKGNYTRPDNVFVHDLAAGEIVVKEMEVRVSLKTRPWWFMIAVVLTLGIYYCLRICGPQKILTRRSKLAITSKGRVLLWKTTADGKQTGKVSKDYTFVSTTQIQAYTVRNLSYIERFYSREERCFGCCSSTNTSTLRMFFGRYLDQYIYDMTSLAPFPSIVTMKKLTAADAEATGVSDDTAAYQVMAEEESIMDAICPSFSVPLGGSSTAEASANGGGIFGFLEAMKQAALASAAIADAHVLEITVPYNDDIHNKGSGKPQGSDWAEMIELERLLLLFRNPKPLVMAQPINKNQYSITTNLVHTVEDNVAQVNPEDIGLDVQNDKIIDVMPSALSWTCFDIIMVIATFGFYYFCVIKKKHAFRSYLLLSSRRLMEVGALSETGKVRPNSEGTDRFTMLVRTWFFGALSEGFVSTSKWDVYGHFATKYGGMIVNPAWSPGPCSGCFVRCTGIPEEVRERHREFLMHFSVTPLVKPLLQGGNPLAECWTAKQFRPIENEVPVHVFKSFQDEPSCLIRCCTCGVFPYVPNQELMVTTHRLWAANRPTNEPWCCDGLCGIKNDFLYWKPLVDLTAIRIKGVGDVAENCWTRMCSKHLAFCRPLKGFVAVKVGALRGFPLFVNRSAMKAEHGLLADEEIGRLRQLFGTIVAAANEHSGEVGEYVVNQAPPQQQAPDTYVQQQYQQPPPQ